MARKRTAPRKRRTTTAPKRPGAAAPKAPAAPSDGRLTNAVLRAKLRRSKEPVIDIFGAFRGAKESAEERMEQIRASMR